MTTTCEAAGCDRAVYARGHCERHYRQLLRHGEVAADWAPQTCAVRSCDRKAVTRGYCHGHYLRWSRTGDVREDKPLARPERATCCYEGCERGVNTAGWCRSHARRVQLYGTPDGGRPARVRSTEGGSISHGYWHVQVPVERRHLVPDGRKKDFEHRLVMAEMIGRPLLPSETVHHLNGDRLDNRPVNLELWSTAQPKGQRVPDKLAFAYEILRVYDPEARGALGLDLDEDTELPHHGESEAASSSDNGLTDKQQVAPTGFEPAPPP